MANLKEVLTEKEAEYILKTSVFHNDSLEIDDYLDMLYDHFVRYSIDEFHIMRLIDDVFCYRGFFHRLVLPVTEYDAIEIFGKLFFMSISSGMFPIFKRDHTYYRLHVSRWLNGITNSALTYFIESESGPYGIPIDIDLNRFMETMKFRGRLFRYLLDCYCNYHRMDMNGLQRILTMVVL